MEGNATATNTLNVLRGKIANISPNALDTSLSIEGAAAEAKATGDAINDFKAKVNTHAENKENPHEVTKKQIGLENVDNTADVDKPVSTAQAEAIAEAKKAGTDAQAALENKVDKEEGKGLSTYDFSEEYKAKVDSLSEGGDAELVLADGSVTPEKLDRAYATLDGNDKVTAAQASAKIKTTSATTYPLVAEDAGKFIQFESSCTAIIPTDEECGIFPVGTEIELYKASAGNSLSVEFDSSDGKFKTTSGEVTTLTTDGDFAVVVLKRISATDWLAKGDLA